MILLFLLINLDTLKFELKYKVHLWDIPKESELKLWIPLPLENQDQKILKG
ncbi:MAG: hypothetical protein ABDH49_08500 [Candidatus Hydrothermales bacterium]